MTTPVSRRLNLAATLFAFSAIAIVAGCAKGPAAIAPVSMGNAYEGIDCARAAAMRNETQAELLALSKSQKQAQIGDAVGVFLIAVPVSSLVGADHEGEIATAKGKINALDSRLLGCNVVAG
jgi:hypothetical protein